MKFKTFDGIAPSGTRGNIERFTAIFTANEKRILENCERIAAIFQKIEGLDFDYLMIPRGECELLTEAKVAIESTRGPLLENFNILNFYKNERRNYPQNATIALAFGDFECRIKKLFELYIAMASLFLQYENNRLLTSVAYARHVDSDSAWALLNKYKNGVEA